MSLIVFMIINKVRSISLIKMNKEKNLKNHYLTSFPSFFFSNEEKVTYLFARLYTRKFNELNSFVLPLASQVAKLRSSAVSTSPEG